ncbi:hypothetical protein SHXM_04121 [Streptomyces hygroscopicus]|nr:hypothetical protein SHXM_04121 [Streptomyces hygroscopicus]
MSFGSEIEEKAKVLLINWGNKQSRSGEMQKIIEFLED